MKYCSSQSRSHETAVGHAEACSKYQTVCSREQSIKRPGLFIWGALHSRHVTTHALFTFPISLTCYKCEGGGHADAEDDEVWPLEEDPHPLAPGQPGIAHALAIKHHGPLLAETGKTRSAADLVVVIPTQIHFRLSGPVLSGVSDGQVSGD